MKKTPAVLAALMIPVLGWADWKLDVGRADFSDWDGVVQAGKNEALLTEGNPVSYTYENMNRRYSGMMRPFVGDAADWYDYAGISFELYLEEPSRAEVVVTFKTDPEDHLELNPASTATVPVSRPPICASVSMPRAIPEAMTNPPVPRSDASPRAMRPPDAEALRAPTMATVSPT